MSILPKAAADEAGTSTAQEPSGPKRRERPNWAGAGVLAACARLFLGAMLVYAAADKLLHPHAFATVIHNYQVLPDSLINLAAMFLPPFELVLGTLLILGVWLPGGSLLAASLLSLFFLIVTFNLIRGLNVDCGCFITSTAEASQAKMIQYVIRDAAFLVPAYYLLYRVFRAGSDRSRNRPGKTPRSFLIRALLQGAWIGLLAVAFGWYLNMVRPQPLPLVGEWSPQAQLQLENGEDLSISLEKAEEAFADGTALFLDARPAEAYAAGHIAGAISLPLEDFEMLFEPVMGAIPPDTLIITYCDGETCGLGWELAKELLSRGYRNVKVLVNGWHLWQSQQLPAGP